MSLNRNRLYLILLTACTAGYIWLYVGLTNAQSGSKPVRVCLFKQLTSIPCPSCGTTRSVISLTQGNFEQALLINPLGYLIAAIMLLTPLWIAFDLATKGSSLFKSYQKTEALLKTPRFAIPLILLIIANWIWNITKNL